MDYALTGLVYDLLFLIVMIFSIAAGWRRGFLSTLTLLVGGVVAIVGAVLLSRMVGPILYHDHVGIAIARQVSESLAETGSDVTATLHGLTFLPESVRESLVQAVQELNGEAAPRIVELLEPIVLPLIQAILFLVVCILVRWLFRLLAWALRRCNVLPLVGGINRLLGGVLGFGMGVINVWLASLVLWLAALLTDGSFAFLSEQSLGLSYAYRFLAGFNPFTIYY